MTDTATEPYESPKVWYVLICRVCDPKGETPMPFTSPKARGHWAAEHKKGTSHDLWLVLEVPND